MTVRDEDLFSNPEELRAYREFCETQQAVPDFQLDRPALVCRWRMAHRQVPLLNRHIRALSQRLVQGRPLTTNMLSWAKQHVEWSLAEGTYADPNGVLMLVIDVNGNAAMTVGAYEPLTSTSHDALVARAEQAHAEQVETGVAPEALCCVKSGTLYMAAAEGEHLCGSMTLVEQLAATRGYRVLRATPGAKDGAVRSLNDLDGAHLLVSDEHGVVVEDDVAESSADALAVAKFLATGVAKLFS